MLHKMQEFVSNNTWIHLQVCEWKDPDQLRALLDLELRDHGESQEKLLQRVHDVAKYSVKTSKLASSLPVCYEWTEA